jgi:peptidyl-tRNA hydrolase
MDDNGTASARHDPDGEAPWAMQIVVDISERDVEHLEIIEAVAHCVSVLICHESTIGGEWTARFDRWRAGRIRKIVRRAKGAGWHRAVARLDELGGVHTSLHGVRVAAFVPGPVDAVDRELARLQVSGLQAPGPRTRDLAAVTPGVVQVALAPIELTTGKMCAQAAHGAQLAVEAFSDEARIAFTAAGHPITISAPNADEFAALIDLWPVVIRDAGFTETGGVVTTTAAAIG